jgi:hypothetical protein
MLSEVLEAIVDSFLWAVALLWVLVEDIKGVGERLLRLKKD